MNEYEYKPGKWHRPGMRIQVDDEGYMRGHPDTGGWLCLACKEEGKFWGIEWRPPEANPPLEDIERHMAEYHHAE